MHNRPRSVLAGLTDFVVQADRDVRVHGKLSGCLDIGIDISWHCQFYFLIFAVDTVRLLKDTIPCTSIVSTFSIVARVLSSSGYDYVCGTSACKIPVSKNRHLYCSSSCSLLLAVLALYTRLCKQPSSFNIRMILSNQ